MIKIMNQLHTIITYQLLIINKQINNCQLIVFITCKFFSPKKILSLTKNNNLITNYNKK